MMDADFINRMDATVKQRVSLGLEKQTPPLCCGYFPSGGRTPCFHGAALIAEKNGSINLHKFIAPCHLTSASFAKYDSICFVIPAQADVDNVMANSENLLASGSKASGSNMSLLFAIASPKEGLQSIARSDCKHRMKKGKQAQKEEVVDARFVEQKVILRIMVIPSIFSKKKWRKLKKKLKRKDKIKYNDCFCHHYRLCCNEQLTW